MHRPDGDVRILGLAGSLRRASYNRKLLHAAIAVAPDDVEVVAWEDLKQLPPFDEDDEPAPGAAVERLRAAITDADALLVVTPEYNGSLPGQLKNALDWASRPRTRSVLDDKPVAVVGGSPSPGGARSAQADGRRVLARAGARVLDHELAVARVHEQFDTTGRLMDPALHARLGHILDALATNARARPCLAA